jgi:hypothetical protein
MTVHQSKGREFAHVSLLASVPNARVTGSEEEILEEAGVIFVACTRAAQTLRRIPAGGLKPLRARDFGNGVRRRWVHRVHHAYQEVEFNMEIGLAGDVSGGSFVDLRLHGSEAAVASVQELLAEGGSDLAGRKVMLCRMPEPGGPGKRLVYGIHLDEAGKPGALLGATSRMLSYDLWQMLKPGFDLPVRIRDLRITDVVTFALQGDDTTGVAPPWSGSGFWLGVHVHGVGEFVPRRRQRGYGA